jgi:hypothetical protein
LRIAYMRVIRPFSTTTVIAVSNSPAGSIRARPRR